MLIMVILIVNGKEKSLNLNPTIKMLIFQLNFVSEVFLMDLDTDSREVSLYGNANDFSVDYLSIDKSDILSIHKYLMTKNNLK